MKQNKLRVFTFLLAVWLLIAALPISAFAELLELETQPMEDPTVYVLAEDTTKRSEFEKHYYCSDGTFVAVTYPEAVHYKDENGEWVDVDMRLASDASAASYESQSGDFKTVFRTPAASGDVSVMANGVSAATPAVSMQSGEYTLSWSLTGTKAAASAGTSTYALNSAEDGGETIMSASADTQIQVLGEMKTAEAALSVQKIPVTDPDAFALPAVSNQVMYEDVFGTEQNVSVRYSVSLNKIEEDILITAPTEMTSFSMQIECGELSPVKNPDNSIDFLDNYGNMVYHVSTPYLADAAFAVSYDVAVTLTQQDGVCTITYTPDTAWMNAPERVYPIMLDPAVTTNEYTYAINDTYVVEGDDTCYYTNQYLLISQSDGKGRAAIIRFSTLPEIDPSMPIISAKLNLSTYIGPNGVDLKLESMESGFNFLMNKYSDWKTWNRTEIDRATYSTGTSVFEFDMTSCITDLYTGNISPDFSVSLYDEDSTTYVSAIHSADTAFGDYYRPCLTITYGYNLPEGLAVGDEITIQNLGSGGYLYPYSALTGNGNPVLHTPFNSSMAPNCMMTLRRNASNGTYKLEYTFYSDDSGAYLSADTSTKNVVMYNTTNVPSNIKQDWLIVPDSINTFKIVLASDMRYVMTAVGDAGTGYVSVDQVTNIPIGNQNNQSWLIYEDGAPKYGLAMTSPPFSTGIYYVNNKETGKFISYNDTYESLGSIGGRIADIGDMIAWKITKLPDGYYTIQNADNLDEFLSVQLGSVVTGTCGETIPSVYKWRIEATSEYYYIKNVGAKKYLYLDTDESTPQIYGVQAGNSDSVCKWRVVKTNAYIELSEDEISFDDLLINVGESGSISIASTATATWAYVGDFYYSIASGDQYTIFDDLTHSFTGTAPGVSHVRVQHKPTGITKSFDVVTDCFDPRCIEYVRITRITDSNLWGAGSKTDHTISIIKSSLISDEFCTIIDNIYGGSREFLIDTELRNMLDALESGYQDHYNIIGLLDKTTLEENAAHSSKGETDQLVEQNYFASESSEYYAVWFYNYTSTLNLINYLRLYMETYTVIYSTYLSVLSFYQSYMLQVTTSNMYVNSTQYQNASSYLDDIDDSMAGISYSEKSIVSAEERNTVWAGRNYDNAPYLPETPVVKVKLNDDVKLVRVYSSSNKPNGSWTMRASDIEGLTASQIEEKFALPNTPTYICDANIPAGTEIYIGIANSNYSQSGGGIQYDLNWANLPEWFSNFRPLS